MPSDPAKKPAIKGKLKEWQVKNAQKMKANVKNEGKKLIKNIGNKLGINKKNK